MNHLSYRDSVEWADVTTYKKMPLAESINRVTHVCHIVVQYTIDQLGVFLGIKNNCLYVFDNGVQIIPLRNKTLHDFNTFVAPNHLLSIGDFILVEDGLDYLELKIIGFRLNQCACGIVGELYTGNRQDRYDVARQNIIGVDREDDTEDIEEMATSARDKAIEILKTKGVYSSIDNSIVVYDDAATKRELDTLAYYFGGAVQEYKGKYYYKTSQRKVLDEVRDYNTFQTNIH